MIGSENLIARNLKQKFIFRKNTIDKWEEIIANNLDEDRLEAALNAIDEYRQLKRYKVVHPISQHPDPTLSHEYKSKLRNFPKLRDYLSQISTQGIPEKVIRNYDKQPRISKFRIKGIRSNERKEIVKQFKSRGLIREFLFKSCEKINQNETINSFICSLMKYAQPNLYKRDELSNFSLLPTHEAVTENIIQNFINCIAIEVPIWHSISKEFYLTGHPDVILLWNDNIIISDYKPSQLTNLGTLRRNLFHSLPQISIYGLLFKQQFNLKDVKCISFNHYKAWIYEPESLLYNLKKILPKYKKDIRMPWNAYLDFKK